MGYVFDEETLPTLVAVTPGRTRTFFVSPELAEGCAEFLAEVKKTIARRQEAGFAGRERPEKREQGEE